MPLSDVNMDETTSWLTSAQLARKWGVSARTVTGMAQREEVPAVRIRGQWRFLPEEIARWERKCRNRPR